MSRELIERAARARSEAVAQRSDRPSERRSEALASVLYRSDLARGCTPALGRIEVRKEAPGASSLAFEGHATVYEARYDMWDMFGPYEEVVSAGAGTNTLSRAGLDVPLVLDHDSLRRIARTTNDSLRLTETDHGLHVLAEQLDPADGDVAYITPKLRSGLVDEMSFKFRIELGEWSPDWTLYRIQRYDIHRGDVAIVGYGASPHTDAGMREAETPAEFRDSRLLAARLSLAIAR